MNRIRLFAIAYLDDDILIAQQREQVRVKEPGRSKAGSIRSLPHDSYAHTHTQARVHAHYPLNVNALFDVRMMMNQRDVMHAMAHMHEEVHARVPGEETCSLTAEHHVSQLGRLALILASPGPALFPQPAI